MMEVIEHTLVEIEDVMRDIVLDILGITESYKNYHKVVRFTYNESSNITAPDWGHDENVCFIEIIPHNTNENKRDVHYIDDPERTMTYIDEHNDDYEIVFVCYGPDSFDWSKRIRNGMFFERIKRKLAKIHFYYNPDIYPPVKSPESYSGVWWMRYDVTVMFQAHVRIIIPDSGVNRIDEVKITPVNSY